VAEFSDPVPLAILSANSGYSAANLAWISWIVPVTATLGSLGMTSTFQVNGTMLHPAMVLLIAGAYEDVSKMLCQRTGLFVTAKQVAPKRPARKIFESMKSVVA
jgi:hypothetical protein